jgi:transcriptional regulator with XRE-family HTH domain
MTTQTTDQKQQLYSNVSEMLESEQLADKDFIRDFNKHINDRQIIKFLMAMRAASGKSQSDIAQTANCSQSRISKLEKSIDDDLRLGDLHCYANALKFNLELFFIPQTATIADKVKYHACFIRQLLKELTSLAITDEKIALGIAGFFGEALFNFIKILQESAKELPLSENNKPYIQILGPNIFQKIEGEELDTNAEESCDACSP